LQLEPYILDKVHFFGIFILSIILGASIFFLLIYPTMRYELRTDALWLICGPFHWKIPYSEIKEIIKTDLRYHPTSTGWKLPGYTIGKVYYIEEMCGCVPQGCVKI
jgi:hypothetical protein